jgi:hypothetical protein
MSERYEPQGLDEYLTRPPEDNPNLKPEDGKRGHWVSDEELASLHWTRRRAIHALRQMRRELDAVLKGLEGT